MVENQTEFRIREESSLCSETSTKMPFKNSISAYDINFWPHFFSRQARSYLDYLDYNNVRWELINNYDGY